MRDPLVYEFETAEAEASYNAWLRAKVERARADPRPPIPHDEVMARMDARIEEIQARQKKA